MLRFCAAVLPLFLIATGAVAQSRNTLSLELILDDQGGDPEITASGSATFPLQRWEAPNFGFGDNRLESFMPLFIANVRPRQVHIYREGRSAELFDEEGVEPLHVTLKLVDAEQQGSVEIDTITDSEVLMSTSAQETTQFWDSSNLSNLIADYSTQFDAVPFRDIEALETPELNARILIDGLSMDANLATYGDINGQMPARPAQMLRITLDPGQWARVEAEAERLTFTFRLTFEKTLSGHVLYEYAPGSVQPPVWAANISAVRNAALTGISIADPKPVAPIAAAELPESRIEYATLKVIFVRPAQARQMWLCEKKKPFVLKSGNPFQRPNVFPNGRVHPADCDGIMVKRASGGSYQVIDPDQPRIKAQEASPGRG